MWGCMNMSGGNAPNASAEILREWLQWLQWLTSGQVSGCKA